MEGNLHEDTIPPQSLSSVANDHTIAPSATGQEQTISEPSMSGLERFESYDSRKLEDWQFGSIYQATHRKLARQVRLIVLNDESRLDPVIRTAFIERVQQIAQSDVANIHVGIWEAVDDDEIVFVACEPPSKAPFSTMSLDESDIASAWFYDNRMSTAMIGAVMHGLVSMHELGIVHGSITKDSLCGGSSHGTLELTGWLTSNWMSSKESEELIQKSADHDLRNFAITILSQLCETDPAQFEACSSPSEINRLIDGKDTSMHQDVKQALAALAFLETADGKRSNPIELTADVSRSSTVKPKIGHWFSRLGTLPYEALFSVWAFFLSLFGLQFAANTVPFAALALVFLLLPSFVYEVIFKTNPGRRIRGLRLLDRTGSKPARKKLLQRWAIRSASITLLGLIGMGLLFIAAKLFDFEVQQDLVWICFPFGIIPTYCTALFLPHRRPVHDYLSGITVSRLEATKNSQAAIETSSSIETIDTLLDQSGKSESGKEHPASNLPLENIDQYRLLSLLGHGGMGFVYSAFDEIINRKVAIKIITASLAKGAESLSRFEREAMLGAQLSHENIAKVFGTGRHDGSPYLAMEHIEGKDLKQLVHESGPVPAARSWDYITQAAQGLKAVSELGIIHRDIKPANIMVDGSGVVKIMDFGVSKQFGQHDVAVHNIEHAPTVQLSSADENTTVTEELTMMGVLVGTPMFMSPEQASAGVLTASSDIYSLGLTLWFMLAGKVPFQSTNSQQLIIKQISDYPSMNEGLLEYLTATQSQVLLRMIAKDPQHRYSSYDELLTDLDLTKPKTQIVASIEKRITAVLMTTIPVILGSWAIMTATPWLGISESVVTAFVLLFLFPSIYIVGIWRFGQTPGKWLARLKVVSVDGSPVSLRASVVRYLASCPFLLTVFLAPLMSGVAGNVCFIVWLIGIAVTYFNPQKRTPHDFAAGTIVVEVPKHAALSDLSKIS